MANSHFQDVTRILSRYRAGDRLDGPREASLPERLLSVLMRAQPSHSEPAYLVPTAMTARECVTGQ